MCGPSAIPKHGTNVFEVSTEYALDKIRYIYTNQSFKRNSDLLAYCVETSDKENTKHLNSIIINLWQYEDKSVQVAMW